MKNKFVILCSTLEFISEIQQYCQNKLNIKGYIRKVGRKTSNTYTLTYSTYDSICIFLNFLYHNATIYLERKYEKYQVFQKILVVLKKD